MLLVDRPFRTLLSREILRFTRVWMQTLVPPLLTSLLYLVVFGVALGSRIREVDGVPYLEYILPGIALMSPMSDLQIALAYSLGGTLRGLVMGAGVFVVGAPFVGLTVAHPGLLLLIAVLSSFTFASLGTMVGAVATRIDHISFLTNVVIQPLAFLGGVFYSVEMLPGLLRVLTLFDPIFHMVNAARFATLETSDLHPYPTLGVVFLLAALAFTGAWWAINRGPNLRY